jgi:uncharacterized protein YjeT (DUF2065 family)
MGETFLAAVALVLILEGVLPLFAPRAWREAFSKMLELTDGQLRFVGLMSFGIGLLLLFLSK